MLKHTKKILNIYDRIQRKLLYMIPEKWDRLYLYCSVLDNPEFKGELYFYYIPRGILKKTPVNVYEIPAKFNISEKEYIELVGALFEEFKEVKDAFAETEPNDIWSNLTLSIEGNKFKVEYFYNKKLKTDEWSNYERHIIWKYNNVDTNTKFLSKREKNIINEYINGPKMLCEKDTYESYIYQGEVNNIIDYDTYTDAEDK